MDQREKALEINDKATHPFEPERPWNHVWKIAVEDVAFWKVELEEPALLVLTNTSKLNHMLGPDADVGTNPVKGSAPDSVAPASGSSSFIASAGPVGRGGVKRKGTHHHVADGHYLKNRRGMTLCKGWNDGTCNAYNRTYPHVCGNDDTLAHQCSKCLSPEHSAKDCGKQPANGHRAKGKSGKGAKSKGRPPY